MSTKRRWWTIALVIIGVLILSVFFAVALIEDALRRYAEREVNDRLPDYNVQIGELHLHPFMLKIELQDLVVRQQAHVEPALATIPRLKARAGFLALLSGTVDIILHIEKPSLAATGQQVDAVVHTPQKEELKEQVVAWQDTIREMMPVRISLYLSEGRLAYQSQPTTDWIEAQALEVTGANITNRPDKYQEYPSELHVTAGLSDQARIDLKGHADFLAKPEPKIEAQLIVERLSLESLLPVMQQYNVQLRQGVLDLSGMVTHAGKMTVLNLDQFLLENVKLDYVHAAQTKEREVKQVKKGVQKVKEVHQDPSIIVKVEHGKILHSEVGFRNTATSPDYRVFMADLNLEMANFSNRREEGMGTMKLTGKFMGSGPTVVNAAFRPEKPNADFNIDVRIVKTQVEALNKLLEAYGPVHVSRGTFAFFSEISVKNNQIEGYFKPFLKDVEVYDPKQDKDKTTMHKVYEAVVKDVLDLFTNPRTGEVATQTDVTGPVENPKADTFQIIQILYQNAFFKAILPGFKAQTH